jgi:hypothetical protein
MEHIYNDLHMVTKVDSISRSSYNISDEDQYNVTKFVPSMMIFFHHAMCGITSQKHEPT